MDCNNCDHEIDKEDGKVLHARRERTSKYMYRLVFSKDCFECGCSEPEEGEK